MKRKKLQQLTERQLQILNVIWERGRATVAEVSHALRRTRLARKTIGTLLSRMEEQGLVSHTVEAREFVYSALVTREQVARAKVRSMLDYVLGGSASPLIRYALEEDEVAPGDIARVEELLHKYRSEKDA
jgi:predicted transcriptional regulator